MTTIGMSCPNCDEPDLEVEVTITYRGHAGNYSGPPESSYPAEGAEWYTEEPVTCEACKTTFTTDQLNDNEKLEQLVQERAAEPPEPPDFYERDYEDLE